MTGTLAHTVNGDGPPLLLLNGGLMTYAAWEPLVPAFSSCRLIRCDFRGQLLSPGEPHATLDGHADDLVRLLDSLGIESAHVAGASFGALCAVTLAARVPARVHSLVAISATDRVTPDMAQAGMALRDAAREAAAGGDRGRVFDVVAATTWSAEFQQANAAMLAARRQALSMLPTEWFVSLDRLVASIENLDLTPDLPRISCPSLVIGGERDLTFPVEHSRALAAGIPHARLVVIEGGSHGLIIERASTVAPMIASFVHEVEASTGSAQQ